jgi:rhodanese-related sulfurtransferase
MLPDPATTIEINPEVVAEWIDLPADQRPKLVDCREQEEIAICQISGHQWLPLGKFPEAIQSLADDSDRGIVVYCHHGMRSRQAAAFLRSRGIENAFSMTGGIEAWSQCVDPSVPRY